MSARGSGLTITRACSRDTPSTPATLRASASSRVIGLRSRGTFGRASGIGEVTNSATSGGRDGRCFVGAWTFQRIDGTGPNQGCCTHREVWGECPGGPEAWTSGPNVKIGSNPFPTSLSEGSERPLGELILQPCWIASAVIDRAIWRNRKWRPPRRYEPRTLWRDLAPVYGLSITHNSGCV
jgi:hypothetical protein